MSTKQLSLATQSFTVDVQKIPNNFQGKIWLPAKNISLTEKWSADPKQWETGNPISRTITIEAEGLRADQIPDLLDDKIAGVNSYAGPPQRSNRFQDNVVIGTWQQKVTYIPNLSQSFNIPALRLNWWNTQTHANAIAQLKSIMVQVRDKPRPDKLTPLSATTIAKTVVENTQMVQESKTNAKEDAFYLSIWFWVSLSLFIIWLITIGWIWTNTLNKKINLKAFKIKRRSSGVNTELLSDKTFAQACEQSDCVLAQKFILSWAKTQWQNPPRNLSKLREIISEENFKKALENLEQALYADEVSQWDGKTLLIAFKKVRKNKTESRSRYAKGKRAGKHQPSDPLPPLYP